MSGIPAGGEPCVQERYAPDGICFGCGPANRAGLRIRSFPGDDGGLVCEWTPSPEHQAFPGVLNGGIIGALLDCHSNWAASWHLMQRDALETPPTCVTADFHVRLRRPTPVDAPVRLHARAASSDGPKVVIEATLEAAGKVTASCTGTFVAVPPDHPAHGRT